jgi:hypothetical protein
VLAQVQTGAVSQTVPGTGNGQAIKTAQASPLVRSAYEFLVSQTFELSNDRLREQTYDAIANPETCILHRRSLTLADKQNIVAELLEAVMNFAPS